jgi:hypothetical protein
VTNILIIGDLVRSYNFLTGPDMVIGFTPDNKVVLLYGGTSDREYFDVIGHYDRSTDNLIMYSEENVR